MPLRGPVESALPHLLVLAGFGLLVVGLADTINFAVDDTFIAFRYAENAAAGKGLVYNPGERVEGISNLLWTLLLALYAKLGANQQASPLALLVAAKLTGAALALATLGLLAWFCHRVRRDREWGDASDLIVLAVLCTSATYTFPAWSMSGLETPLCAFLVTLAGVLFLVGLRRFHATATAPVAPFVWGGVVFGILSMARPEQIFIWGLAMAAFAWIAPRALRPALIRSAAITLAIYLGVEAWRWAYYGSLVPNSVIAKSGGGLVTSIIGLKYALAGLASIAGFAALGYLALPRLVRGRPDWQFVALYCGAYVVFVLISGGDWMPGYRFYAPVLPLLWLLSLAALLAFMGSIQPRVAPLALGTLIAVMAASAFALGRAQVRAQMEFPTGFRGVTWHASPARIEVARAVQRLVPPGSLFAIFEAGCVPYFNPELRVLDNSGLMDRAIARMPQRHMFKLTADYFLERAPDHYLMMVRVGSPQADGLTLLASPEFKARYRVVERFTSLDHSLGQPAGPAGRAIEEDLSFVLYRRVR